MVQGVNWTFKTEQLSSFLFVDLAGNSDVVKSQLNQILIQMYAIKWKSRAVHNENKYRPQINRTIE